MNYLITGITGFVGSHMADFILEKEKDSKIYAIKRWRSDAKNIEKIIKSDRVKFIEADLLDRSSLRESIQTSKPDVIYHFAAQSFPGASFKCPSKTIQTNVIGTVNLLEEILHFRNSNKQDKNPRIVSVSSSEVYGMPKKDEVPITEENKIRAANPYSISKVGQDLMSQYYYSAFDLDIVITRMFSHEGPRRGEMFALSSFAKQIAENEVMISKGFRQKLPNILHGNLDSVRTYSHIKDAIEAYYICAKKCTAGEVYNIGGDSTCTVGDALDVLISKSKYPELMIKKEDKERIRPTDITLQIPSSEKFRKETGWKPSLGIEDICEDLLNYWRVLANDKT